MKSLHPKARRKKKIRPRRLTLLLRTAMIKNFKLKKRLILTKLRT
jgi:hypothetical protein